eukprot:jgi/Tetstr1/426165/TSEL_016491.t1
MHGCRICAEYLDLDLDQAGSLLHRKRLCRDGAAALTPAAWSAAVPQAQTFTPKYDFKRQFTAALTPRLVKALATQELCLEVWHHSPRTQALKTVLGSSRTEPPPSSSKPKDVFLGTACASLLPLLTRAQGLRTWLPLKSRRGEPVGAVQLAVHFLRIGERANIACHSPLERFPALEDMLPPSVGVQHYMPSGFDGQPARASVYIEDAVLPPEEEVRIHRPSSGAASEYYATYRLPGSSSAEATHSVAGSKLQAPEAGERRAGRLHFGFCGIHWVTAGAGLAHALSSSLMQLELHRKEPQPRRGTQSADPPPIGLAQVDLMPLMLEISKKGSSGARWVAGTFHLVCPFTKDLGGARVKVKVMLELRPVGDDSAPGLRPRWDIQGSGLANISPAVTPVKKAPAVAKTDSEPEPPAGGAALPDSITLAPHPAAEAHRASPAAEGSLAQGAVAEYADEAQPPASQRADSPHGVAPVTEAPGSDASGDHRGSGESGGVVERGAADPRETSAAAPSPSAPSASTTTGGQQAARGQGSAPRVTCPAPPAARPAESTTRAPGPRSPGSGSPPAASPPQHVGLRCCVERAANLRLRAAQLSAGHAEVFVLCEWPVAGETCATAAARVNPATAAAEWCHTRRLPIPRRRPARSPGGFATAATVVFKVYVRTRPLGAGGASGAYRPPREEAVEAGDVLLGSAALDLTLLWLGLDKIEGWYNLLDVNQQPAGQLKVELTPLESLAAPVPVVDSRELPLNLINSAEFQASSAQYGAAAASAPSSGRTPQGGHNPQGAVPEERSADVWAQMFTQDGTARSFMRTSPLASDSQLSMDLKSRLKGERSANH